MLRCVCYCVVQFVLWLALLNKLNAPIEAGCAFTFPVVGARWKNSLTVPGNSLTVTGNSLTDTGNSLTVTGNW